jgi:hypothetical protein
MPKRSSIGYCSNVHAGQSLETYWAQLKQHAVATRELLGYGESLPLGLWFSERTANELSRDASLLDRFGDWLREQRLAPYTMNGFPQGDFHGPIVKHAVYQPTWLEKSRVEYTRTLIELLHRLLPPGDVGTISTLPIAWGDPRLGHEGYQTAARHLWQLVDVLSTLEQDTGRRIVLCLEPEPGCVLGTSRDVIAFFRDYLDQDARPSNRSVEVRKRYLGVCHDICHASVMFEGQPEVIHAYEAAAIAIAKVQVSAAIEVTFPSSSDSIGSQEIMAELARFAEDRYLHQTSCRHPDGTISFHEDLKELVTSERMPLPEECWRIHFHVPIFAKSLGRIGSTQNDIYAWRDAMRFTEQLPHLEVETYAWNVLPEEFRPNELSQGIAQEVQWLRNMMKFDQTAA